MWIDESRALVLARRVMMRIENTDMKLCDAIELICKEEPQETKYEILQRCTRIICDKKSKQLEEII